MAKGLVDTAMKPSKKRYQKSALRIIEETVHILRTGPGLLLSGRQLIECGNRVVTAPRRAWRQVPRFATLHGNRSTGNQADEANEKEKGGHSGHHCKHLSEG